MTNCKFIWQREYEPVKTIAVSGASDFHAPDWVVGFILTSLSREHKMYQ